ncbi:hypothetical protein BpHYR1_035255 [Brachionus plicatilis]|uniref:Uncharacterized protein n=1 Tax=Brachionus plicatilis TaxID=10195 RepID=A0A3M7QG77_BRAPC|nr:hypothetical protein BpHYR1_035255 [Brachionus plicatilis]
MILICSYGFTKIYANLTDFTKSFFQGSSEWQSLLFSPHGCNMIKICINYIKGFKQNLQKQKILTNMNHLNLFDVPKGKITKNYIKFEKKIAPVLLIWVSVKFLRTLFLLYGIEAIEFALTKKPFDSKFQFSCHYVTMDCSPIARITSSTLKISMALERSQTKKYENENISLILFLEHN